MMLTLQNAYLWTTDLSNEWRGESGLLFTIIFVLIRVTDYMNSLYKYLYAIKN